ncbi:MAG: CheB methylesterase domain-containing protein [Planctomycetota bacterium]
MQEAPKELPESFCAKSANKEFAAKPSVRPNRRAATRLVAIGVSTGGPSTLLDVVPLFPADLNAAVVIVQHMPENFTGPFAQRLNKFSAIPVKESAPGDILLAGHGYLARGDKHLMFSKPSPTQPAMIRAVSEPSDVHHRPSVDIMMKSAVETFGHNTIGVLLTGMGSDGAEGMVEIRNAGGQTIAEDESTCVVFGMPAQAIQRGGAVHVLPSHRIAEKVMRLLGHRV